MTPNQDTIYVLGDSHIISLVKNRPDLFYSPPSDVCTPNFRSITAYSVGRETQRGYVQEVTEQIPHGSKVLISFGEIDCRHYIPAEAIKKRITIDAEVTDVAAPYIENTLRSLAKDYRLIVLGPYVCPEDREQKDGNTFYDILRAKTVFNLQLQLFCKYSQCVFVPIFEVAFNYGWHDLPQGEVFLDSSHLGPCMIPVIEDAVRGFKWEGHD